jgi:hypothetical protein
VLEGVDRTLHAPLNVLKISACHIRLLELSRSVLVSLSGIGLIRKPPRAFVSDV